MKILFHKRIILYRPFYRCINVSCYKISIGQCVDRYPRRLNVLVLEMSLTVYLYIMSSGTRFDLTAHRPSSTPWAAIKKIRPNLQEGLFVPQSVAHAAVDMSAFGTFSGPAGPNLVLENIKDEDVDCPPDAQIQSCSLMWVQYSNGWEGYVPCQGYSVNYVS